MKLAVHLLRLIEKVLTVDNFDVKGTHPPAIKEEPSLNGTPDPGLSNAKAASWKDSISGTGITEAPAMKNGTAHSGNLAKNQVKGNKYGKVSGTGLASPVLAKWTQSKPTIDQEPEMKNGTSHGKGLGKNDIKGASYG